MNIKIIPLILIIITLTALNAQQYKVTGTSKVDSWGPVYGEEERTSTIMVDLLYLKLLTTDDEGRIIPVILEEPPERSTTETLESKLHLKLRDDVLWQDGTPVTTKDVYFTWKVIQYSNVNTVKEKISQITDMSIESDYEMDVFFEHNLSDNPGALTFYLMPQHKLYDNTSNNPYEFSPDHEFFQEEPVTNGKFVALSVDDSKCTLQNNDRFYDDDVKSKLYDIFQWKSSDNFGNIEKDVINGNCNFVMDMPVKVWQHWDTMGSWGTLVPKTLDSFQMMAFNLRNEKFQDYNLRLLFNSVISKKAINNSYLNNKAEILTGPFPRTSEYYNDNANTPGLGGKPLDVALEQFGYNKTSSSLKKNGEVIGSFTLVYLNSKPDDELIAGYIKDIVKQKLNIDIKLNKLEKAAYNDRVFYSHDFDLALVEVAFGTDPSIYNIFHSSAAQAGGFNVCGFSDPVLDDLLERGKTVKDAIDKIEIYHLQHDLLAKELPAIFLFQKPFGIFAGVEFYVTPENLDSNLIFNHIETWR